MDAATTGMADLLAGATQFLTWMVSAMTQFTTWALADDLAFTYIAIFFVSVACGFVFRILRSV